MADWAALDGAITGTVLWPGRAGYDEARRPPIVRYRDVRPAAVVRCATEDDVATALNFAGRAGLPVAVRSGGHSFAGRSSSTGVVLDTSLMDTIEIGDGTVTVGAGVRLGDLYERLATHGVTIPAGSGPTVGIAGLTLGGGLGTLGRAHGLTCDSLLAARVVLASEVAVECDAEREADLFWALRGGGSPGVVTRLTFATVPAPDAIAFHLTWSPEHAAAVIAAWQATAPDAPETVAASLVVSAAADPTRPPVVSLFGAASAGHSGPATRPAGTASADVAPVSAQRSGSADARPPDGGAGGAVPAQIAPASADLTGVIDAGSGGHVAAQMAAASAGLDDLEARVTAAVGHAPLTRVRHAGTHLEVKRFLTGLDVYGDGPVKPPELPDRCRSSYFRRSLPDDAVAALVDHLVAGRVAGQSRELDFTPWGGAYNRVPEESTAFPHRAERFLLKLTASDPAEEWLAGAWALAAPYGTGGRYPNFPEPGLPDEAYYGRNMPRLHAVRASYDPAGVFLGTRES
jgi:FAD/FMN-containing dehydrogenase